MNCDSLSGDDIFEAVLISDTSESSVILEAHLADVDRNSSLSKVIIYVNISD